MAEPGQLQGDQIFDLVVGALREDLPRDQLVLLLVRTPSADALCFGLTQSRKTLLVRCFPFMISASEDGSLTAGSDFKAAAN
jgi:hypothetical protein